MRKHLRAAAVMVGVFASGGAWASPEDEEERAHPSALPEAVADRLQTEFPGAVVTDVARWGGGWEATLVAGLRRQEVLLDASGTVVERHVPVAARDLPDAVQATLARTYPRHEVWRATRIESADGTYHQLLLARGERRSVVVLDPEAKVLAGMTRA